MNTKGITIFTVILMIAISSMGMASAGLFDNNVDIDGIKFNIPSGFKEIEDDDFKKQESDFFKGNDVETKVYEKTTPDPNHPGVASFFYDISISVISSSKDLTLDDVNSTGFEKTTINGKSGLTNSSPGATGIEFKDFYFAQDGKIVHVQLSGSESMSSEVDFKDILLK